jgi:hypothetical protein
MGRKDEGVGRTQKWERNTELGVGSLPFGNKRRLYEDFLTSRRILFTYFQSSEYDESNIGTRISDKNDPWSGEC